MDHKLLKPLIGALCITALLHVVASTLKIYSYVIGFDKIVHFFGGISVGIFYFMYRSAFKKVELRFGTLPVLLFFVIVVGLLWEVFEARIGFAPMIGSYWQDTLLDSLANIAGALAAYFLYTKSNEIDA